MEDVDTDRSEAKPPEGMQWLSPSIYLPFLSDEIPLAGEFAQLYETDLQKGDDDSGDDHVYFPEIVNQVQVFAHRMIRYAQSKNLADSCATIDEDSVMLVNPNTNKAYTLEDLEIDRRACMGGTQGVQGREEMVARTTVAILSALLASAQEEIGEGDIDIKTELHRMLTQQMQSFY